MPKTTPNILTVIGTRPEAIKMAPIIQELHRRSITHHVCASGQHRELLTATMEDLGVRIDQNFNVMTANQGLSETLAKTVPAIEGAIRECSADIIIAQGDTLTVLASAIATFHSGRHFAHIEAGLRSGDLRAPFPEEAYRRMTSVVTRWHFCPTVNAKHNLEAEGIPTSDIHVVGNTVIDSVMSTWKKVQHGHPANLGSFKRHALLTLHRRESFGDSMKSILHMVRKYLQSNPDLAVIYPVHPNPQIQSLAWSELGHLDNALLVDPMPYSELVNVMGHSWCALTDSGGIQEEGPALGIPVVVFREVTERPEAVSAGGAFLVGDSVEKFQQVMSRLEDAAEYATIAQPRFPYGDGHAARRIVDVLEKCS